MPRARNIKPGFFKNEELVEIPFEYRLLFVGLWMLADRAGRMEDRPKRIKMEVFPADEVDIDAGLNVLQARGFLIRYEVNGGRYIQVLNFEKHQSPHVKESPSLLPAPDEHQTSPVQAPDQPDINPPDSLNPSSLNPSSLNPSSLNPSSLNPDVLIAESLQNPSSAAPTEPGPKREPLAEGFAEFWDAYPKKVEKKAALAAWKAKKLNGHAQEVIDHVRQRATQDKSWLDGFVPSPKRFIRDERWKDEYTQALSHREKVLRSIENRENPIIEGRLTNG
jgi:hypothetical protein